MGNNQVGHEKHRAAEEQLEGRALADEERSEPRGPYGLDHQDDGRLGRGDASLRPGLHGDGSRA
jgi:hypothetical protein